MKNNIRSRRPEITGTPIQPLNLRFRKNFAFPLKLFSQRAENAIVEITGGKMKRAWGKGCRLVSGFILTAIAAWLVPTASPAADSVCARVKIEINQELTLERQAFDAHLRITNGLADLTLEDTRVDVFFTDEDGNPVAASSDPENTEALFFIRLDSLDNIDDVSGGGRVSPSTAADVHWLIVPSPGSSNGLESGTLYYVGARLSYSINGEEKITEVTPDYILVKPMPQIALEYFLPEAVYGDDPFTPQIEPPVPFSMGMRLSNTGHGIAENLKIDSARPVIVDNEQGLLIGFSIESSEVNGRTASDSLLAGFGDIGPGLAATARWNMTCTLSGRFVEFTAGLSHSNELGGELTSLISDAHTHLLIHDIMVDLPGRDSVRDFLAKDVDVYRVYESDLVDTEVLDLTASAFLQVAGDSGSLVMPPTAGFMYVRLNDPFEGRKSVETLIRSDGKVIKKENVWLSRQRTEDHGWRHFINLFDVNSAGNYVIDFSHPQGLGLPPVLQPLVDRIAVEGEQIRFTVAAEDPDGTSPVLSAAPLPAGADFSDQGDGTGVFDWTPITGQAGTYELIITAADGTFTDSRRLTLTIRSFSDTDADDLDDAWEMDQFGSLERDGSGDFDHDGISDYDEFQNKTDPAELADLGIRQDVDSISGQVGDQILITLTVTNKGPKDTDGIRVLDILPAGLSHVSDDADGSYDPVTGVWEIGHLSAAALENLARIRIIAEVVQEGSILNIATISDSDVYDPQRADNSSGLMLNAGNQSDLAVSQTVDNSTPAGGDVVNFMVTAANNGPDDATGVQIRCQTAAAFTCEDCTAGNGDYDPTTGMWNLEELKAGDTAALHLSLIASNADEILSTAAVVRSDQLDPDPTDNRSTVAVNPNLTDHPYMADLAVLETTNQTGSNVGDLIVLTRIIRNSGPDEALAVEMDGSLPAGLTPLSSTASGGVYDLQSGQWQVERIPAAHYVRIDTVAQITGAGEWTVSAGIAGLDEFDPDGGNDSADLNVSGMAADIAVTAAAEPARPNVGQPVLLTITAANDGPGDAVAVQIDATIPSGLEYRSNEASQGDYDPDAGSWFVGGLAAGSVASLQITVTAEKYGEMIARAMRTASNPPDVNPATDSAEALVIANACPLIGAIPAQSIAEGSGFDALELDSLVTDPDNQAEEMMWTFSGNDRLQIHIDPNRRAVIEVPDSDWYGSEIVMFRATDPAGLFAQRAATFTVAAVNDPPVNRLPGPQTIAEDTNLVLHPSISISDVDADANVVEARLTAAHGVLTLGTTMGLGFISGDGTADTAMRFTGTLAAINDGLAGLRFIPDADFHGNAAVEIETDDLGHTGAGGPAIDRDSVSITVSAVNDPPQAAISPTFSGKEGEGIALAGNATDIDSDTLIYYWDFTYNGTFEADAGGIDLTDPVWIYKDDGLYTVALQVADTNGAVSEVVTGQVTVGDLAPDAAFTWSPQPAVEGSPITFTDASRSYPDSIVSWDWDFGDGRVSNEGHPHLSFMDNGTFTVRLTVTDDDGSVDTVSQAIRVDNVLPLVDAGSDRTVNEGDEIVFAGGFTDSGADTHSLVWDFGDGNTASGTLNPLHTYADNGRYTVTLTVVDDDGAVGEDALIVIVNNASPRVQTGSDRMADEGEPISFSGSFSDPGAYDSHTLEWDFGDGTPPVDGTLTPIHTYGDNGSFTVTLRVTDNEGQAGMDTLTVDVHNVSPVLTDLISDSVSNGDIQIRGAFGDQGWQDRHHGSFDFGDGLAAEMDAAEVNAPPEAAGTVSTSHHFDREGLYTIRASVVDDEGARSESKTADVVIDKTPPVITIIEPRSGYYPNTRDIEIHFDVEDPESGGVSSGVAADGMAAYLDDEPIESDQTIHLAALDEGNHRLRVTASDEAGNTSETEVAFEVGPVPALTDITPSEWRLNLLNPFDDPACPKCKESKEDKRSLTASISTNGAAVETILPTFAAPMLQAGSRYQDFTVVEVIAAQQSASGAAARIKSVTVQYTGTECIDILACSGDTILDFYNIEAGEVITIDAGEKNHLSDYTVLSAYPIKAPPYSAADIIPDTIRLNGKVPIVPGSAELIVADPSRLDQPRIFAEAPYAVVGEGKHHVRIVGPGDPQRISLEVGGRKIFEDQSCPIRWHDGFGFADDGRTQTMGVFGQGDHLRVFYQNLTAEARIYLDGALALTILPAAEVVTMQVRFDGFAAVSSLAAEQLVRAGNWQVTTYEGVRLVDTDFDRRLTLNMSGAPRGATLKVGETVIFSDRQLPLRWTDRCFIVDGERQDMAIYTSARRGTEEQLSIHIRNLTRKASLCLDGKPVLEISPPPEVAVPITGDLELDGDPTTFDGSFRSFDEITLTGKLPDTYDPRQKFTCVSIHPETPGWKSGIGSAISGLSGSVKNMNSIGSTPWSSETKDRNRQKSNSIAIPA